jgi:hypothetical protein
VKLDGSKVKDFSQTCSDVGSCWDKFHQIHLPKGLFSNKQIDDGWQKIQSLMHQFICF